MPARAIASASWLASLVPPRTRARIVADPLLPWLTIIGIGEDGLAGLSDASRKALASAEMGFGGERDLQWAEIGKRGRSWPVRFDVAPVLACRGRPTAVLASGDPFWHGAGGSLACHLSAGEWIAHPAPSTFSLAAARLGWRLEDVYFPRLHAAPFERPWAPVSRAARIICPCPGPQA